MIAAHKTCPACGLSLFYDFYSWGYFCHQGHSFSAIDLMRNSVGEAKPSGAEPTERPDSAAKPSSRLVFGTTRVIPLLQEQTTTIDYLMQVFLEAYHGLRQACPRGDLRIHLSVEAKSPADVGAVLVNEERR